VWHNLLSSNDDALYIVYHCDPRIEANEIHGQLQHGIFLNNYNAPEIHQNNISHNGEQGLYLLRNQQSDDIQAQNNWWGTDDMGQIGSLIWDVHDNTGLGEVFLDPILTAPVDSAGPRTFPTR
jgi:parallel beta-helix repeat protein